MTAIESATFYNCQKLQHITIPDSLTSIEGYAFGNCYSLTSITVPKTVKTIGNSAFCDCLKLEKVVITDISSWAGIEFGEYTTSNPLYYAHNLFISESPVTDIVLNDISKIRRHAFVGCTGLKSVVITNSVDSIETCAFNGCSGLSEMVIPNSVTYIGSSAFAGCSGLTQVNIPNSVTEIGGYAFNGCSKITEVVLPNSIKIINANTFSGCVGLAKLTIPNTVTEISTSAFYGCNNLNYISNLSLIPQTISSNSFSKCGELHVYEGLKDVYSASAWKAFTIIDDIPIVKATSIAIDKSEFHCNIGEKIQASAIIAPENATSNAVTWSSDDISIVIINPNTGEFAGISEGNATITATTLDGSNLTASAIVYVGEIPPTYIRGDANGDSSIDVADISATASYILGSSPAGFVIEAADVNEDKEIDVADISGIANIILNGSGVKSRAGADGIGVSVADFEIKPGETKEVAINLNNPKDEFTGLQLDLYLPEGISIPKEDGEYKINFGSRTTYKKHSLESALQEDGAIRLLMYSAKNNTFSGESGDVVILTLKADDNLTAGTKTINLKNTVLSRADGSKAEPEDSKCNVTVKSEDPQPSDIAVFVSDFEMLAGETKEVTVNLNNSGDEFTGLQLDLYLPEGISIPKEEDEYKIDFGSRTTYKKHSLESALQEDGAIRLLMYSAKNNTFSGESGDVIILTLKADDNLSAGAKTIDLKNIVLSRADGSKAEPKDSKATVTISVFDDIETIDVTAESNISIYTITGTKLSTPQKGINIIGGKKVFVK